jgi:hypothetical protein
VKIRMMTMIMMILTIDMQLISIGLGSSNARLAVWSGLPSLLDYYVESYLDWVLIVAGRRRAGGRLMP